MKVFCLYYVVAELFCFELNVREICYPRECTCYIEGQETARLVQNRNFCFQLSDSLQFTVMSCRYLGEGCVCV